MGAPPVDRHEAAPVSPTRKRTGLYIGIVAMALIAAGGVLALTDLGFGFNAVHISSVDLEFTGANCDGWVNATAPGISANVGSHVAIPIPLTDSAAAGTCVAENVTASPDNFSIASANVPLRVPARTTGSLSLVVGLPTSSYSGVLTLIIGVSTEG